MNSLVSIITPAYRAESFIARAVQSVIAQTYTNWEMIIISDDGQDYNAILSGQGIDDKRLRFASTGQVGSGLSHARNVGLDVAAKPIIALLDADDAFYPRKLERMLPLARQHGFCCSAFDYVRYDEGGKTLIRSVGVTTKTGPLTPQQYGEVYYSGNAICVFDRKQFPIRWREDFPLAEDIVFVMDAFTHSNHIYHLNEVLHEYIYTENSLSTAKEASTRFVAAKKRILDLLDRGEMDFSTPDAVSAFRRFITLSMEAEYEYGKAMERGEAITFTEILERRLAVG